MDATTRPRLGRWLIAALILLAVGAVAWDAIRTTEEVEEVVDRYERVNARIEAAMPKDQGIRAVSGALEAPPADLTIELRTRDAGEGLGPQVEIRMGEEGPWTLPLPPSDLPEDGSDASWWEDAEPTWQQVTRAARTLVDTRDVRNARTLTSLDVPNQVAIRALSILIEVGVTDVGFGRVGN